MLINSHTLIAAKDAGGGYHGRCKHCNLALVTDLGYCSWDNTTCIDREVETEEEVPSEIRSYLQFRGMHHVKGSKPILFTQPYGEESYTIEQIQQMMPIIQQ